jgi:hypothetical protein
VIETAPPPVSLAAVFEVGLTDARAPGVATSSSTRHFGTHPGGASVLVDRFSESEAISAFLRLRGGSGRAHELTIENVAGLSTCPAGGWLLRPAIATARTYWIPVAPVSRGLSGNGHVLREEGPALEAIAVSDDRIALTLRARAEDALDIVVWALPRAIVGELTDLVPIETQRCFLWGSHTPYRGPADVYEHLIHGAVYENRYAWPHRRKICSENDAHALFLVLSGLERATGKRIYRLLKQQILLSVLARQSPDGGFRHGEWTDGMEAHFRLNASAMHLCLDALEERDDPAVREALGSGIRFLGRQRDRLAAGTWFLHDELELSEAGMDRAPFRWIKSRAFGKSPSNMLVLNTHIDTTIAIDRYREASGDDAYAQDAVCARAATRFLLAQRPAEWLYRLLFALIRPTLLPSERARALPLPVRAMKRLASKYLIPNLHRVKTRFPRLVMPGGYVDRAVPLATWAFHYLPINIMDLVRYQRRFPDDDLGTIVEDAVRFTRTSGVLDRWQELAYEKYALGFWAEALYQLCMLSPRLELRDWLAGAVLRLEDMSMGLPPSLLGANCEVVPRAQQRPTPSPADARLRVVNLAGGGRPEYLVVNTAPVALRAAWSDRGPPPPGIAWTGPCGNAPEGKLPLVPPRSWLLGRG